MNNLKDKSDNDENKKIVTGFPWEFKALMISLVLGGILIVLKVAGIF
ncbi:MAG TPA: hypothetical protein VF270_07080 [Ignavibacteriaceae bacterium]